jgi:hypothetical protein
VFSFPAKLIDIDTRKHLRQRSTARQNKPTCGDWVIEARKDRQMADGGFGESFASAVSHLTIRSSEHPSSVPPVLFIQLLSTTT